MKRTKKLCTIPSSNAHQILLSARVKWEIGSHVVDFAIESTPGVILLVVLFEYRWGYP